MTLRYGQRMNTLFIKLGWKTMLRDLRAGELRRLYRGWYASQLRR